MAMLELANLTAVLAVVQDQAIQRAFRQDVVLPRLLRMEQGSGKNLAYSAKFSGRDTAEYGANDMTAAKISSHSKLLAQLEWARLNTFGGVDNLAQAVAASYRGNDRIAAVDQDAIMEEIVDAVNEMAVKLSIDSYTGQHYAATTQISGATTMATLGDGGAATTYAGIDSTGLDVATEWQTPTATWDLNTAVDGVLTDVAIREQLIRPFRNRNPNGRAPDFITINPTYWDMLLRSYTNKESVQIERVRVSTGETVDLMADLGARALTIDGVPIIEDRHCPLAQVHAWSYEGSFYRVLPGYKSQALDFPGLRAAFKAVTGVEPQDRQIKALMDRRNTLGPMISAVPTASTGQWFRAELFIQMGHRRHSHAILTITDTTP